MSCLSLIVTAIGSGCERRRRLVIDRCLDVPQFAELHGVVAKGFDDLAHVSGGQRSLYFRSSTALDDLRGPVPLARAGRDPDRPRRDAAGCPSRLRAPAFRTPCRRIGRAPYCS